MNERVPGFTRYLLGERRREQAIKTIRKEPLTVREAKWTREMIDKTRLPKKNLRVINKLENPPGQEAVMATWQPWNGELTLYKNINKLPRRAQWGVMAHELGGHGASPLDWRNDTLFGGQENRLKAYQSAKKGALESAKYKVYLDPYHKSLAEQYERGEINMPRYIEEFNAIRVQKVYEDPKGLEIKSESLIKAAAEKGEKVGNMFDGAEEDVLMIVPEFKGDKRLMRQTIGYEREQLNTEGENRVFKQTAQAMLAI